MGSSNHRRLGMGLDALLGPAESGTDPGEGLREIQVERIRPNPLQPRKEFDPEEIRSLAESIRSSGILQPVVVRPAVDGFELVAGERRWRAAKEAGLAKVPAVIRTVDDPGMFKMALIENLQRRDLNPIEKAEAFRALMTRFGCTQEALAAEMGLDRTTVANFVRLLDLPAEIREAVAKGLISQGHARAILAAGSPAEKVRLLRKIVRDGLSVREAERLAYAKKPKNKRASTTPVFRDLEEKFTAVLGTRVRIQPGRKGGKIIIEYYSGEHLSGLLNQFGVAA